MGPRVGTVRARLQPRLDGTGLSARAAARDTEWPYGSASCSSRRSGSLPSSCRRRLTYQRPNGGKLGVNLVKLGFVQRRGDHRPAEQAVRRAVDQPQPSSRSTRPSSSSSRRDGPEVPDHPAQPGRRDADDRDDRPDQRLRHGRHQVHDGLQRRARRRVGDGGPRGDRRRYYGIAAPAQRVGPAAGGRARSTSRRDARARGDAGSPTTGDVEVLEELEEISAEALDAAGRGGAGHQAGQRAC